MKDKLFVKRTFIIVLSTVGMKTEDHNRKREPRLTPTLLAKIHDLVTAVLTLNPTYACMIHILMLKSSAHTVEFRVRGKEMYAQASKGSRQF